MPNELRRLEMQMPPGPYREATALIDTMLDGLFERLGKVEDYLARTTAARDAIAGELRTVETAINEAGGTVFQQNADFIAQLKRERDELLKACQLLLAQFGDAYRDPCDREALNAARTAVANATGKSRRARSYGQYEVAPLVQFEVSRSLCGVIATFDQQHDAELFAEAMFEADDSARMDKLRDEFEEPAQ